MLKLHQRLIVGLLLLLALLTGASTRDAVLLHRATLAQQSLPLAQAATEIGQFAGEGAEIAFASILLGALLCLAIVLWIVVPIHSVAESARRIGRGDLDRTIDYPHNDNLGAIGGEINRLAAQLRDLRETESGQRQIEQQLSDAVVRSIFEPVIVTDAKGEVLKLNQSAEDLLGTKHGDRAGVAENAGGAKILEAVREAVSMHTSVAVKGEAAALPLKIGQQQRSYRLRTAPMRDADGNLLGAVSVLEDVTGMQDLERFKTRFLTIASQKLREPLRNLRLALYSLTRGFAGELRPLQADLIQGAEEEAERLDELMADLIEVSELETGHREMRIDRVRPIDVLRDAQNRHREEARKKDIDVEIRALSDLSPVHGDRRALRSILDNLLTNALRYTPEGGAILLYAQEHKDKVQFFVRDSGVGIEAERLPGIFGRFNTSVEGGTGLGLAVVRRLVELSGGQVSVESRLGHGTTFSFTLPVAAAPASRHPIEVG